MTPPDLGKRLQCEDPHTFRRQVLELLSSVADRMTRGGSAHITRAQNPLVISFRLDLIDHLSSSGRGVPTSFQPPGTTGATGATGARGRNLTRWLTMTRHLAHVNGRKCSNENQDSPPIPWSWRPLEFQHSLSLTSFAERICIEHDHNRTILGVP